MSLKKVVIILIIMAITSAFVFIYYRRNFATNFNQPENNDVISQKVPTQEEKRQWLFTALEVLNNQSGQTRQNLTPAEEQAKKQELFNELKALSN